MLVPGTYSIVVVLAAFLLHGTAFTVVVVTGATVRSLTVWPVKSLGGPLALDAVAADETGLSGDRRRAVVDPEETPLSARQAPRLLRWTAEPDGVRDPEGTLHGWAEDGLDATLSDDLGRDVRLVQAPAGAADLEGSVLVTTVASHADVEAALGPVDLRRLRTNLHLDLDEDAYAEAGWEGRAMTVGDVVLQLLHPCLRCVITTYEPGGTVRDKRLLRWFAQERAGVFGINARVTTPGVLRVGDPVRVV